MEGQNPTPSSGTGLDPKVSGLLCYFLGFVGGIVFYAISKDKFVRFHAMQSIFLSIAIAIVYAVLTVLLVVIPFLFFVSRIIYLGVIAIWIIMMVKAYNGEKYKLPLIGDLAEKYSA